MVSNLGMFVNPSPNHFTTTPLAGVLLLGNNKRKFSWQQTIINTAKGRFPNLTTKQTIFKIKPGLGLNYRLFS